MRSTSASRPVPAGLGHLPAGAPARARRALTAPVIGLALALTLAGCGGGAEPEPTPTPTPTASGSPLETLLEEYLGDWSNEQVSAQLVRMEELVAACMNEQGFDYTPVDYAAMDLDLTGEDLDAEWGTAEFAQEYGYGLTTDPRLGEPAEDPNAEYVAGMSASEQDAYHRALYGEQYATLSVDPQAAAAASWEDLGCTGAAQNELLGVGDEDDEFAALQQDLAAMTAAADADPRLNQADADWAACMAGRGHADLSAVGDGEAALAAELAAVQQQATLAATDPTTGEVDRARAQAALEEPLAELREREIELAVADAECRADSGYDEVRADVDAEYQAEFLAEHREELMQWLASLNELRED